MDRFVGKRLDGRYEIQEKIGVGGMAEVYKAYDNVEDRIVAVKILKEEFVTNEEFIRRFKNESKAIAVLSHENIVKVYDVSFGDLIQYIVMEYIEGITLKEFIERNGSLRWKDAVSFTVQILRALQHAHDKGIVHRDVKPQNIMVLADMSIKVTDFGIARFARNEQRTITDKAIGSVHYISPEQARGEKTDERADIYSVGVMLYEMLTGQLPFEAESAVSVAIMQLQHEPTLPTKINSSIPLGLEHITMHAMQKLVDKRYQSAAEMLCDLDSFRKDPTVTFEYSYFVDDSPTKFVGDLGPAKSDVVETVVTSKSATIPILGGIAAALVIIIAVLGIIFGKQLFGTKATPEIACPNFVGQTEDQIKGNSEYDKFNIDFKYKSDDNYAKGVVCEQSITEGKKIKSGAKITVYVSEGKTKIKVSDVTGKNQAYAEKELQNQGFETVISEIADEKIAAGLVVKTDPAADSMAVEGSTVTIYISTGKEIKMVNLPNVVGLTEARAKSDITNAGLIPVVEKRDLTVGDKYYAAGYVISQNPDANSATKIAEGTNVTVYVSTGIYSFDLKVTLPSDYKNDSGYVTLWSDGKMLAKSELVKINEIGSYTFKNLSSKEKTLAISVEFLPEDSSKYDVYFKANVDASTGKLSEKVEKSYPKK